MDRLSAAGANEDRDDRGALGEFPAPLNHAGADRPFQTGFPPRFVALAGFLLPLWYVGLIAAVVLHEIVGHGCTSHLLGGTFTGFTIHPDGMGWAEVECEPHWFAVAAGGIIATTVGGMALVLVAMQMKKRPLTRLTMLVFAFAFFNDGLPYGFWNAAYPDPDGDIGEILATLQAGPGLRWSLVVAFGAAYLAANAGVLLLMWRSMGAVLGRFSFESAMGVSLVLVGPPGIAYWLSFDWEQLIAGVGRLPMVVGVLLHVALTAALVFIRRVEVPTETGGPRKWLLPIGMSWLACAAAALVVLLWLRHGVTL